ncbi:MAG: polysaccharide biosynthesis protein [Alphaproteobacteria bacterium]
MRFGNVLGSAGSVVPLFQKQLKRGGPITVTDRAMTRYFMTIDEAVGLVLQAASLGAADGESPAEHARIYVLDMGVPVNITALAEQMVRLAGLEPYKDVAIAFTGARKGEKLHEELFHSDEASVATPHESIRLARARPLRRAEALAAIDALIAAAKEGQDGAIEGLLKRLVPEYHLS